MLEKNRQIKTLSEDQTLKNTTGKEIKRGRSGVETSVCSRWGEPGGTRAPKNFSFPLQGMWLLKLCPKLVY